MQKWTLKVRELNSCHELSNAKYENRNTGRQYKEALNGSYKLIFRLCISGFLRTQG